MNLWNLAVGTAELMLCALCVIQILTLRTLDRRARVCLLCFCCCMLPFVGGNLVGQLLRGKPGAFIHGVLLAANCCEFLFSAGLAYIGARYLLALQKLRFGDDLNVVYELECESFSLPTLTLQPLVENAVSHGIRRTESGGAPSPSGPASWRTAGSSASRTTARASTPASQPPARAPTWPCPTSAPVWPGSAAGAC